MNGSVHYFFIIRCAPDRVTAAGKRSTPERRTLDLTQPTIGSIATPTKTCAAPVTVAPEADVWSRKGKPHEDASPVASSREITSGPEARIATDRSVADSRGVRPVKR